MMKFSSLFSNSFPLLRTVLITSVLTLTGCSLGMSSEIKTAETMLNHFECKNIESTELVHSPITNYHEHALSASKDKATTYLESYKSGDVLFKIPLNEVIQQQYDIYKASCESLGGIQTEANIQE